MKNKGIFYFFLAPALLLSLSVVMVPAVMTLYISLTDWNGISAHIRFEGLDNYRELIADSVFRKALTNNIKWLVLFVTIPVIVGMLVSLALLNKKRSQNTYQVMFLLPFILAPITNSMLWLDVIYNPVAGLLSYLSKMGWDINSPLSSVKTALYGVAAVDIWHYWGYLMVIYFAALRQTPMDQIEAAFVEGAKRWQLFRYVYLPNVMPSVRLMFAIIAIASFMNFEYVYLLTGGGPARATEMMSTLAYNYAFSIFDMGKASAVAAFMSLFGLMASFVYIWSSRRESMS